MVAVLVAAASGLILFWFPDTVSDSFAPASISDTVNHGCALVLQLWNYLPTSLSISSETSADSDNDATPRIFTKDELLRFKYKYLAIVGEVFDVGDDRGVKHYGPDGGYNFFTGLFQFLNVGVNIAIQFQTDLCNHLSIAHSIPVNPPGLGGDPPEF